MLIVAWTLAVVLSLPQCWVFHLQYHPKYPWYGQCVTYGSFSNRYGSEFVYRGSYLMLPYHQSYAVAYACIIPRVFVLFSVVRDHGCSLGQRLFRGSEMFVVREVLKWAGA